MRTTPVFGGGACRVEQCRRPARGQGMCPGHLQRWVKEGRPDLKVFVAVTDPGWQRQRPNAQCVVTGCGYGSARAGMCVTHGQRWDRAGRPDLDEWLADAASVIPPAGGVTCRIDHCRLWPQGDLLFCHAHGQTWKTNGRPDIDQFATGFSQRVVTEDEAIRFDGLGQLTLEIQYAVQCRHDERSSKLFPTVVMQVVRFLAGTTVTSLLDRDEDTWRAQIGRPAPKDGTPRALLIYARRKVEDLVDAGGWEAEYPRDVWQLRRLGFPGQQTLNFQGIAQAWLRDLVKRWAGSARHGSGIGGRPPRVACPDPVRAIL